jgi:hypothetical protein
MAWKTRYTEAVRSGKGEQEKAEALARDIGDFVFWGCDENEPDAEALNEVLRRERPQPQEPRRKDG